MDIRDTLTIFAQIAVAFAGFGGLAGLVAPKLGGDGAKLAAARLRAVIEWALVVVAFSLLPLVMLDLAPGEDLWRVLSACLALSAVAHRLWVGPKLHDQHVAERGRADVHERDGSFVLVHQVGRQLARHDLAEGAICLHARVLPPETVRAGA